MPAEKYQEDRAATLARLVLLLALLALAALGAMPTPTGGHSFWRWTALAAAVAAGVASFAFLAARERRHAVEDQFLARLSGMLQVERGLAESLRLVLEAVAQEFRCGQAIVAARDEELDRLFVWRVRPGEVAPIAPETLPLARADSYLADTLETTLCWNSLEGPGEGFGWERANGRRLDALTRPPETSREILGTGPLLAATLDAAAGPAGRLLLSEGKRKFVARDLRWFERIARHVGPPLENIFLLRHLRARAVEAERSRISRDLHDGILQTLLSLGIQLDVLRRKVSQRSDKVGADLAALQKMLRQESEELRRMVTDLRPLRVESADLIELMCSFAERFRNESGLAVDLFIEGRDLRVPDRVCRELFQIYRESLHNIKKHARSSHVVVKLWQDETKVFLVVDDNGLGFSFAGRYTSEELDRLRLGPISIKERTRSVGGVLTVESSPGHGARLTIEIPLS